MSFNEENPRGFKRRKSELLIFESDLKDLRLRGFSFPQIQRWLQGKGVVVSLSTVQRFFRG